MAIAGVFCAFEAATKGNVVAAPISLGVMAGIIILDLIVWWGSLNAEPTRRQWLGNRLYWGGCIGGAFLLVAGVFFVIVSGISQNPFWVFNLAFAAAVFWLPALVCWKFGQAFRYILSGP